MTDVSIRIAGAHGDGIESSGALLIKVATRNGLHVYSYRGYQSIIRGGHGWYQIRLGDSKMYNHGDRVDILIALNQDSIKNQKSHLRDGAVVIYDPSKVKVEELDASKYKLIALPMIDMAVKISGDPIMRNVAALGTVLKLVGIDISAFTSTVTGMFLRKGQKIVDDNVKVAEAGYNFAGVTTLYNIKGDGKQRYSMDGNTAFAMGAFSAGCNFYSAYPMTPASGILHWFASHENKGILFKQTEDEIAAVNMAIGAANAGARAMCGTSGGGFSLMTEAVGLAGMLEVPVVIVDSQRTGPSTGLPTKTEQGDLLFVMHSSQGEFPRIVVAPRNIKECFEIGSQVHNLAERYQTPVLVLLDLYLSEHIESIDGGFDLDKVTIDRGKLLSSNPGTGRFKRYEITDDGVSPRSVPGTPGMEFIAPSDEHNEYGDLISDALAGLDESVEMRIKMNEKRMRKIDTMLKNESVFVPQVDGEGSDYYFVTFGSTTDAAIEAAELLKAKGMKIGIVSFNYLMPLDKEKTKRILQGKRLIDVECNFTAQLAQVIMMNTGIEINNKILKHDGEAITGDEIAAKAAEIIKNYK